MIVLLYVQPFPAKTFCWCASFHAISHSVFLIWLSSSFVSLMLRNDSCSSRKSFLSLLFCDIIDNRVPWGHDNWSQQGYLQWHGGTIAKGDCQRVSFFNVNFNPAAISAVVNNSVYFISSQVTAVELKRCSKLTAQFCFFIIISEIWLVWYIFLHEWANL